MYLQLDGTFTSSARENRHFQPESWTSSEFQRGTLIDPIVLSNVDTASNNVITLPFQKPSLEEQLFNATAHAKIWTSRVAMHLDNDAKNRFFRQIDRLHDVDEWADGDSPINLDSYKGFIRAIVHHKINQRPALALMPNGNLLAIWQDGETKISVEFLPADCVRWFAKCSVQGKIARATGTDSLTRLRDVLMPYQGERWFHAS